MESPVRGVRFRHANDRPPIALLSAGADAGPQRVSAIRRAVCAGGWNCVPVAVEGEELLQVSGFEKEAELLSFLQNFHFAEGKPAFTAEPGDNPTRTSGEWLQDTSQKLAGWANAVGDVSLLLSGIASGRSKEITSGALYTTGAGILAAYGNVKTERHLREVAEKTAKFLKSQAGNLPEECGLFHILQEKREGALPTIDRFLARYPTQSMIGIYTLGAMTMLQSGIKNRDPWGIAYGANSTLAGAASILVPEKKAGAAKPPAESPVGRLFDWFQEKPLRMVGYAYILSDIALGMSAYREYKTNPKQKGYIFKFISAATFTVGSLMLAMSNKDHTNADGKFDDDEQRRITALAAEAIARQPQAMQEALVCNVAGFLAGQGEMRGTAQDIGEAIREQLAHMRSNPWVARAEAGALIVPAHYK